jgi:hypothetical protein
MKPPWYLNAACLVGCALLAAGAEARFYRWVDENGVTHYTDTLPPTQVEKGHTDMNERGMVVGKTLPAKTPEELKRDKELERIRDTEERAKKRQEAADKMLLSTFRSIDDLITARDGHLASIEGMVKLTRSNILRLQARLHDLRAAAANLERTGKPIPPQLNQNIGKTEQSIRDAYAVVVDQEQQKQKTLATFASDVKRFRILKGISDTSDEPEQDSKPDPLLKNLIPCVDADTCDRLWAKASAYLRQHASTPIQASASKQVMIVQPNGTDDISLTLSRILDKQGTGGSLFIDAQCNTTANQDTTCTTQEKQRLMNGLHDAVTAPEGKD